MTYRLIDTEIWSDPWFEDLGPDGNRKATPPKEQEQEQELKENPLPPFGGSVDKTIATILSEIPGDHETTAVDQGEKTEALPEKPKQDEQKTQPEAPASKKAKKTQHRAEEPEIPKALNDGPFLKAWSEWIQHLREKRKIPTPSAMSKQLALCNAIGIEPAIKMIERSIQNNWIGLFPENGNHPKRVEAFDAMAYLRDMVNQGGGNADQ